MRLTNTIKTHLPELVRELEGLNIPDDKIYYTFLVIHNSKYPLRAQTCATIVTEASEISPVVWHQHLVRCLQSKTFENETQVYEFISQYAAWVDTVYDGAEKFGAPLERI